MHLTPKSHFDVYLTGGGGLFHRCQEFTTPTRDLRSFGFFPIAVPANQVISSSSVNKPGIDAGAGIAFGAKWHAKVYAEARYNRILMGSLHVDYVPVSFGFRW